MASKLFLLGVGCALLLSTVSSHKTKPSKDKQKLLSEYQKFEKEVAGSIANIIATLQETKESCTEGGKVGENCPQAPTRSPISDDDEVLENLHERLDQIEDTLGTLFPNNTILVAPLTDKNVNNHTDSNSDGNTDHSIATTTDPNTATTSDCNIATTTTDRNIATTACQTAVTWSSKQQPPLLVRQPPAGEILYQVVQRQDEYDKPFLIECEAEGDPPPKYRWTKDGREFNWKNFADRISQQPGRGDLLFSSPKDEDQGQYQCSASNKWGTATSNSAFARTAYQDSFEEKETEMVVAEEGKPFKLACGSPDGYPKPKVFWILQNNLGMVKYPNSSRITVDPDGHLWFSNVTQLDRSIDSNYACATFSPFRNEYKIGNRVFLRVAPPSNSASISKHEPFTQYLTKRNTVALKGDDLALWCIVGGTPLPEIKWSRKGGELAADRVQYDNHGKTLRIREVGFDDEGSYDCDATNGVGTPVSHSVQLKVLAAPYFTVEPQIQNAAAGERMEFRCEAEGRPSPEIKWTHNGVPLERASPNPRRRLVGPNKIVIDYLWKEDSGNYGCNATNVWGYVYKDVFVNVLAVPAEISEPPSDTVTVDGKTITLHCRVFGAPKPLVRWIRDGEELTGGRCRVMESGDLEIGSVSFVDAGTYTCMAENKFGSDKKSADLVVREHTRIQKAPEDAQVAAGSRVTFLCSAIVDPRLSIRIDWLRDGVSIGFEAEPRYVKLQDNSLTIDKVTESDSGIYTCLARTGLDGSEANATLLVQDRPNPPELIQVKCNKRDAAIQTLDGLGRN